MPSETALIVVGMQNDFCANEGCLLKRCGHDMSSNGGSYYGDSERQHEHLVPWWFGLRSRFSPAFFRAAMQAKTDLHMRIF